MWDCDKNLWNWSLGCSCLGASNHPESQLGALSEGARFLGIREGRTDPQICLEFWCQSRFLHPSEHAFISACIHICLRLPITVPAWSGDPQIDMIFPRSLFLGYPLILSANYQKCCLPGLRQETAPGLTLEVVFPP